MHDWFCGHCWHDALAWVMAVKDYAVTLWRLR